MSTKKRKSICLQCNKFPLIILKPDKPGKIDIYCTCGYLKTLLIEEYLNLLDKKENYQEINYCVSHNQTFKYFCRTWLLNLCPLCIEQHKSHKTLELNNNIDIELMHEKIKKSHDI